jgi:hypothetical protein
MNVEVSRVLRWIACGAIVPVLLAGLTACGPKSSEQTPIGQNVKVPRKGSTVSAPPVKEVVADAEKRIKQSVSSSGCKETFGLSVISLSISRTQWCDHVKRQLAPASAVGQASYADQGAVVDYKRSGKKTSYPTVVLVRDEDGLYHLAFVYGDGTGSVAKSPSDDASLHASAAAVTHALRTRDCATFAKVIFTGFGPGSTGNKSDICRTLRSLALPAALAANRKLAPKIYGANSFYAFLGFDTVVGHFTVVLGRTARGKGANVTARGPYRYIRAYLTNPGAK